MDKRKAEDNLKATELFVCELQKESEDYQLMLASLEKELLDVSCIGFAKDNNRD
mgnify:FL=1